MEFVARTEGRKPIMKMFNQNCVLIAKNSIAEHQNTHLVLNNCTPDSNIVKWFWQAVEGYDNEMRARLLQFVTGSSRVPLQGFKALQGRIL